MPEHARSPSRCSGFPSFVLLDTRAHIGCLENETTAHGKTSAGRRIDVSFVVVDPPGLSHCIVNCPDLTEDDSRPYVTGADGAFLLVRVFFPERDNRQMFTDVFVYKAGPGKPSLCLLPRPYPIRIHSSYVGVLSCGADSNHCLVVVPERRIGAFRRLKYDLQVFSTKTKSWSTKEPLVSWDTDRCYEFEPTKVFSVEGGSLAWVDLQFGILLCKGVEENPEMLMIQLPTLREFNKEKFGIDSDGCSPPMDGIRDVTFRNGYFRLIEMEFLDLVDSNTLQPRWRATIFKRTVCSIWQLCGTVNSTDFLLSDSCYLFPEISDDKENKPILDKVVSSLPTLDLYNDDVVYVIAKLKPIDPNGWVLAVNTKSKKLEEIRPFSAERLYFHRFYLQCAFSKHLSKTQGFLMENTSIGDIPLIPFVSSILVLQYQFRKLEEHMEHENRRYGEVWPLLHGDLASSLNLHIEQVVGYAVSKGQGKAAYDALTIYKKAAKEIGISWNDPSACAETMRCKIDVAVGALDNLLQMVPSEVMDFGRKMFAVATDGQSVGEVAIAEKLESQVLTA